MSDTPSCTDEDAACDEVSTASARLARMNEELQRLRAENCRLIQQQQQQQQCERESLGGASDSVQLEFIQAQQELSRCKEALQAMKADRKRLASEKADLVSQMKQLYNTLKDKESELRDFIRNYEQRSNDNNDVINQLSQDKERLDAERRSALCQCELLTDQLSSLQTDLTHKNDLIDRLKHLLRQARLPVDVSTQHLVSMEMTSHNSSLNDSLLMSTSVNKIACSVDELPLDQHRYQPHQHQYQQMFTAALDDCSPTAQCIPRTSSLSEPSRPSDLRRRLLAQRASQIAAQRLQQQQQRHDDDDADDDVSRSVTTQYRHNSFTGTTTSSGIYSTIFSNHSRVSGPPRRTSSFLVQRGPAGDNSPLVALQQAHSLAVSEWKASHVLAWLEYDMNMAAYGQACFDNVKSGKILLGLSDAELESAFRLESSLHRRKMRLAIEELRDPATVEYPLASKLEPSWLANDWLYSLGLSQYSAVFESQLVDGRLLNVLSKKDLDKHLNIHNKFHQSSILHGVQLLRMLRFDTQALQERRERCRDADCDVMVWTNQRLKQWADHIDLQEYAEKLKDSGVHGAMLVLDTSFTADMLANLLAIPTAKSYVRRHLATEYDVIVQPARSWFESNKKATSNSRSSTPVRSHTSHAHSPASANDTALSHCRNSARRLSFKGSLVRALRGQSSSKELPPPPAQPPSSSSSSSSPSSSLSTAAAAVTSLPASSTS